MIAQIVKLCFPEQLERRMRETEAEKAKFELCLPAFFYNMPMFPGETLSLHLFEPRYKLMMRRIIDTSRRYCFILLNFFFTDRQRGSTCASASRCLFSTDSVVVCSTLLTLVCACVASRRRMWFLWDPQLEKTPMIYFQPGGVRKPPPIFAPPKPPACQSSTSDSLTSRTTARTCLPRATPPWWRKL